MPNKSLGQHWLKDRYVLEHIAECAEVSHNDTVLEIGPGLGTLTSVLLACAQHVVAVEFDSELARKLPGQFPGKNLEVINQDILSYDLTTLPSGYKVVANVPYYITSKIVQALMTSQNKPAMAVLLVQKEVAERLAAKPGDMSILAISAQLYSEVTLGDVVPAELFTPPPKVHSQVVLLKTRPRALVAKEGEKTFFRVVKAGFAAKRKKLVSNLAGGLQRPKDEIENIVVRVGLSSNVRAEDVSLEQWKEIATFLYK